MKPWPPGSLVALFCQSGGFIGIASKWLHTSGLRRDKEIESIAEADGKASERQKELGEQREWRGIRIRRLREGRRGFLEMVRPALEIELDSITKAAEQARETLREHDRQEREQKREQERGKGWER